MRIPSKGELEQKNGSGLTGLNKLLSVDYITITSFFFFFTRHLSIHEFSNPCIVKVAIISLLCVQQLKATEQNAKTICMPASFKILILWNLEYEQNDSI